MAAPSLPPLSELDVRVLGVLVEKQATVPDTYPLSLNALAAGCNQKTSRDPVMSVTEAEIQSSIEHLRELSLVIETSGSRVARYAHNVGKALQVPSAAVALLATLMLRGPQTAAELRANSERLHRFADVSAVEGYLHELAERPAGALAVELPRQPGSRETRWAHLLSGAPELSARAEHAAYSARATDAAERAAAVDAAALEARFAEQDARIAALEADVAVLREMLARMP